MVVTIEGVAVDTAHPTNEAVASCVKLGFEGKTFESMQSFLLVDRCNILTEKVVFTTRFSERPIVKAL
jgi:hypothetical protein